MKKIRLRAAAALAAAALFTSVMPAAFAEYDADVIPVYEDAGGAEELSVAAAMPETSKFSYNIENGKLTVSLNDAVINNKTGDDVDAIIAVYDGDILLRTKIHKISGDYDKVTVKDWQTEVPDSGNIRVRAFMWSSDGNCKPVEESSELGNVPSTAYKVNGRIIATSLSDYSLKKDEVKFSVERSDDFDGKAVSPESVTTEIFKTGTTNARDLLFIYSEAYVVKNAETNEYTLMSIRPVGDPQTVTFAADDVADDDSMIGTEYIANGKLPVYKDENTSSTTKYDLAQYAEMYVNGVDAGIATDGMIENYILNNPTGTVTLIDGSAPGSTATDGKYDYIMVDYYVDAVVDYVTTTSSKAKIYFKQSQISASKMEWDPADEDIDITFTRDGKKIDYTELKEYDVLSIKYNIIDEGYNSSSLTDKDYYDVLVSSDSVEGSVESRDEERESITIGGKTYDLNWYMTTTYDYGPGTKYKVYLDVFGYIAYFEEGASDKNYGVIVAMKQAPGKDHPTVRLITANAESVEYECKDEAEADKFYNYATDTYNGYQNGGFRKDDEIVKNRIRTGQTVCTYVITDDRIRFDKAYMGYGGDALEYKANLNKLGSYSISGEVTRIIDMDAYMNGDSDKVRTLTTESFEDEAEYTAYLFDKNNDSVYRFAIVFGGTSSIRPETQIAVVKSLNVTKTVESTTCNAYTVFKGGQEAELLVEDYASDLNEGDVIAYVTGPDGYTEEDDLYILYSTGGSYEQTFADMRSNNDFGEALQYTVKRTDGRYNGRWEIAYRGYPSSTKDVFAYAGVVYRKTDKYFELLTTQQGGETQVMETVDFGIDADTNIYTYDYSKASGEGLRVVQGNSPIQNASVFNEAYINGNNTIAWNNAGEAKPQLAFVKEVDGKATDIVFYVPEDYKEGEAPEPDTEAETIDYGVIVAMFQDQSKDHPTVRLITANAEVVEYECKDAEEADRFYNYATGTYNGYNGGFRKTDEKVRNRIINGQTVCTYKQLNGKIKLDMELMGVGSNYGLEYKASSSKLGSYRISDEVTRIVDMDAFMYGDSGKARALTTESLEDGAEYSAYLFDRNADSVYRFAIVFGGTSSIRPETQIAVVKAANGQKDIDLTTCSSYTVAKGGQEVEMLYEDEYSYLAEGTVIAYITSPEGSVEDGDLYVLYSPSSTYDATFANILARDDFGTLLENVIPVTSGRYAGRYEIAYHGRKSYSKDVFAYVGVVYEKNANYASIFTSQYGGQSQVEDAVDIDLSSANIYTFDYNERFNNGVRLSVGNSPRQPIAVFNQAFVNDKNAVEWDDLDGGTPQLAFIKEVDGKATDAVFYIAP